jgi:hypothetical protein
MEIVAGLMMIVKDGGDGGGAGEEPDPPPPHPAASSIEIRAKVTAMRAVLTIVLPRPS